MFPRFATDRKAAGSVGARREAPLDRFTDTDVFFLNFLAPSDAGQIPGAGVLRYIDEIEIEDHFGLVYTTGNNKVRVHRLRITVNHEVWINPVVQSPVNAVKRTRLQTKPVSKFDPVFGVIKSSVQRLMKVRDVITAVEIVVDKDFPITVDEIVPPLKPVKVSNA